MGAIVLIVARVGVHMTRKCEAVKQPALYEGEIYEDVGDEPVFTLRARDKFFVPLVRMWIELVEADAAAPPSNALCRKLMDALDLANRAIDWQNDSARRVARHH